MPLSRFTVLEAGGDVAVRYCGRLFSRLGARVVRLGTDDDARIGYAGGAGEAFGRWLDQGKSNHRDTAPPGASFDLVLCGQDPAGVARGQAVRDGLPGSPTLLALTWFDPAGPYGDWVGSDEVIQSLNGVAFGFGEPGQAPMLPQGHAPQIVGGVTAFNAAMAVLLNPPERRPARIDVSILEAALCFSETGAIAAAASSLGIESQRLGVNRFSPTFPASSYRTADGWLGVTALTPAQWTALCAMLGLPHLSTDPRFAAAFMRLANAEELDRSLCPAFLTRTTAEWVALGDRHRVPTTPMPTPADLPDTEHWSGLGAFAPIGPGDVRGPDLPFRMSFEAAGVMPWSPGDGEGLLSGLRVIDFGMGWAGPLAARTLADLGADVIKIESHTHQDWWRGWEAGDADPTLRETKLNFIGVNRNKRGVAIDLTTSEGLADAKRLIAGADLVLENYAAGVMAKLGLDAATLRALNPGLVSLSMPAFGSGGPLTGLRAYGSTVEQASGLPFVNGEAHWPPCLQHVAYGDPVAGLFGAAAALAGLAGRQTRGGSDIDLAQVQCLFQLGADAMVAAQVLTELPRTGRRRARLALCTVVACAGTEAWLTVALKTEDLPRLAAIVGSSSADPDAIEADLAAWAAARSPMDAAARLQDLGLAAAPVQRATALCHDEHLLSTGFWPMMTRAYVGDHRAPAAPFRFDGRRPAMRLPAPLLGEHTDDVVAELP